MRSDEDFELEVVLEFSTRFWRTIDADANFLKHADLDWDKAIAVDTLKTDWSSWQRALLTLI